jgi:hypothetical protein
MRSPHESRADVVNGEWLPAALCRLLALTIGLLGLLATLLQMMANMNFRFERPAHCILFLVGWLTAATCFYSAYRLMRYSSYRRLWCGLFAGAMLVIDFWPYSLPSASGLMH